MIADGKSTFLGWQSALPVSVLCCALVWTTAVPGSGAAPPAEPAAGFVPHSLGVSGEDFGPQYLDVDRKQRAFLLRSHTLEVFRLDAAGKLEPVVRLKGPAGLGSSGNVQAAVMNGSEDEWFVLRGSDVWLETSQGSSKLPPVGWRIDGLSRIGSEPVVSVFPFGVGKVVGRRPIRAGDPAPQLLVLAGSSWVELTTEGAIPTLQEVRDDYARINQERMLALAPSGERSLWAADVYHYRVRLLNAAGRSRFTLKGSQVIRLRDDSEGATQAVVQAAGPVAAGRSGLANLAISTVLGLAEGPDGRLYMITQPESDLALDRFDPVELKLERLALDLDYRGRFTLAPAAEGLYLATYTGSGGRWFLTWEQLSAAAWTPVADVELSE